MSNLLDKIMVVDGDEVVLSPEIKLRMEVVFNEAVEERLEDAELNGIEIVLETMDSMELQKSRELVENRLIADGVIEVSGDGGDVDEKNEQSGFVSEIAKMIG